MDFTFDIVTNKHISDLFDVIHSIDQQKIPNYEIIIVGGDMGSYNHPKIKHIPFNESSKTGWITKKKT